MESLRAWVLVLAGTALFGAVVGALAPEGGTRRAFRVLFAVVFLYVCLLPLRSLPALQLCRLRPSVSGRFQALVLVPASALVSAPVSMVQA